MKEKTTSSPFRMGAAMSYEKSTREPVADPHVDRWEAPATHPTGKKGGGTVSHATFHLTTRRLDAIQSVAVVRSA